MTLFANTIRNRLVFFNFIQTAVTLSLFTLFSWHAGKAGMGQLSLSTGVLALMVALLFLVLIAVWHADSITSPITALTHDLSQYANGLMPEFKPSRPPKQTPAELMQLVEALNNALGNHAQADLAELTAIASHDLQEPLRKIQTFAKLLQQHHADALDGQGLDYLARMQSATERMCLLINNILIYASLSESPTNFTSISLNQVTAEVLEDLALAISQAHAHVTVSAMPDITADAIQIRQLLQNLLSNAIKFRRPGITPEISIQARLLQSSRTPNQICELIVSDNGIGFEMIYTEKIFAMFQRLHGHSDFPGTGLGLAICKKIAQRHNGDISVISKINLGTTFTVLLGGSADGK